MLELKREKETHTEVRAKRFQEEDRSGDSFRSYTQITFVLKKQMEVKERHGNIKKKYYQD